MIFHRGEQVVHRHFGVGKVITIEGMNFTGNQPSLYYHVEFNKTTIWIPVDNKLSGSLRPITPKKQLDHFRAVLASSPAKRDDDFNIRKNELEILVDHGTFQALCEVVRDLNAWNSIRPLNNYENALLKQSRATLVREWSETSGVSTDEALDEIDGYLANGSENRGLERDLYDLLGADASKALKNK